MATASTVVVIAEGVDAKAAAHGFTLRARVQDPRALAAADLPVLLNVNYNSLGNVNPKTANEIMLRLLGG